MKSGSILLLPAALAVTCLAAVCLSPAAAYIKAPPQTLGSVCLQPDHICVLQVEKVGAENGVILFKHVEQLKGRHDGAVVKHVIRPDVKGAKVILDGAVEGKKAVMFYFTGGNDRGHVYIDGYWYWVGGENGNPGKGVRSEVWWFAHEGEPKLLSIYCGTADQLRDAVAKILRGEEVVVPCMASDDKEALEQRRGKVHNLPASLKIVEPETILRLGRNKNAGDKRANGKKADDGKADRVGTVQALSGDATRFTLLPSPTEKNKEPAAIEIQICERTRVTVGDEAGKLSVGQTVSVWLEKGSANVAATVRIGKPSEK